MGLSVFRITVVGVLSVLRGPFRKALYRCGSGVRSPPGTLNAMYCVQHGHACAVKLTDNIEFIVEYYDAGCSIVVLSVLYSV